MIQNYITKDNSGDYLLTQSGNKAVFATTISKLLQYYMKEGLKLEEEYIQNKISKLSNFLNENYHTSDDYLQKIHLMAAFIGVSNEAHLSTFIGKNFLKFVEKEKIKFIEEQSKLYQNIHENPYRTPSNFLMEYYSKLFLQAPPFVFDVKDFESKKEMANEVKTYNSNAKQSTTGNNLPSSKNIKEKTSPPGEELLQKLADLFKNAPALPCLDIENMDDSQFHNKKKDIQDKIKDLPSQITFKEYATISQHINTFQSKKDSAGYKTWYQKLNLKYKISVQIFSLLQNEKKNNYINWDAKFNAFSKQTGIKNHILWKTHVEMKNYSIILPELQNILKEVAISYKNLYLEIVNCFNHKEDKVFKKIKIQAILLQISNTSTREQIKLKLNSLIDNMLN